MCCSCLSGLTQRWTQMGGVTFSVIVCKPGTLMPPHIEKSNNLTRAITTKDEQWCTKMRCVWWVCVCVHLAERWAFGTSFIQWLTCARRIRHNYTSLRSLCQHVGFSAPRFVREYKSRALKEGDWKHNSSHCGLRALSLREKSTWTSFLAIWSITRH